MTFHRTQNDDSNLHHADLKRLGVPSWYLDFTSLPKHCLQNSIECANGVLVFIHVRTPSSSFKIFPKDSSNFHKEMYNSLLEEQSGGFSSPIGEGILEWILESFHKWRDVIFFSFYHIQSDNHKSTIR